MASVYDVHAVSAPVGAFTGATEWPVIYIPASVGKITILSVKASGNTAGTSVGLIAVKMSNLGTPAIMSGTIGAFAGTIVYAAGVVFDATIAKATFDPGTTGAWIGVDQASGTAPATATLHVSYVMGQG
jgi:hypothetical protein